MCRRSPLNQQELGRVEPGAEFAELRGAWMRRDNLALKSRREGGCRFQCQVTNDYIECFGISTGSFILTVSNPTTQPIPLTSVFSGAAYPSYRQRPDNLRMFRI